MKLHEQLERELPIDQRVNILLADTSKEDQKLEAIVNSDIGFYEKLYLLYWTSGLENIERATEHVYDYLFSQMTIGEILSELLKPHLVEQGLKQYPTLDFSVMFSDPRYNYVSEFIQTIKEDELYFEFWNKIEEYAELSIEEKYITGMKHFAEVVGQMTSQQPFIKSDPKLVFQTTTEKQYVLGLLDWLRGKNYFKMPISDSLQDFISSVHPKERGKKSRKYKPSQGAKDWGSKLDAMDKNKITIFALEFEGATNTPSLMTFRAKCLRSARQKLALAYSGLTAFHGEGIYSTVLERLPFLLEQAAKEKKAKGKGHRRFLEASQNLWETVFDTLPRDRPERLTANRKKEAWEEYRDRRDAYWKTLSSPVRKAIVEAVGNYGSMISKFNTWEEVQNSLNDLGGITLAYPLEDFWDLATKYVVNTLCSGGARNLLFEGSVDEVDYIQNPPHYTGIHLYVVVDETNKSEKLYLVDEKSPMPIEVHITDVMSLLKNDAVGEGNHQLYHARKRRDFLDKAPKAEPILVYIEKVVGEKEAPGITRGYLRPVKTGFHELPGFLRRVGIPAKDYVKPSSP